LGISIDGYIAPGWMAHSTFCYARDFSMAESFASVDTGIMGRKTYEMAKAQLRTLHLWFSLFKVYSLMFRSREDLYPTLPMC
jgi:dihydrofolate reductase